MASTTSGVVTGQPRTVSPKGYPELTVYEKDVITFKGQTGSAHSFAVKNTAGADVVGPTANGGAISLEWKGMSAGTYTYYCVPHASSMKGIITVLPGAAPGSGGERHARALQRRSTTSNNDIKVRVFMYEQKPGRQSGVFEDDGREKTDCLGTVLTGAWKDWSAGFETALQDTKYFGYSCKKCKKEIMVEQKRFGYKLKGSDEYIRDAEPTGFMVMEGISPVSLARLVYFCTHVCPVYVYESLELRKSRRVDPN